MKPFCFDHLQLALVKPRHSNETLLPPTLNLSGRGYQQAKLDFAGNKHRAYDGRLNQWIDGFRTNQKARNQALPKLLSVCVALTIDPIALTWK